MLNWEWGRAGRRDTGRGGVAGAGQNQVGIGKGVHDDGVIDAEGGFRKCFVGDFRVDAGLRRRTGDWPVRNRKPLVCLVESIGWGHGDCAPWPFHTTGRAVFRIRRLNPAEVVSSTPPRAPTE